jgi:hypothetical protein
VPGGRLDEYQAKRDFTRTTEPSGGPAPSPAAGAAPGGGRLQDLPPL